MQHDLLNAAVFKTFSLHPTIKYQALQRATNLLLLSVFVQQHILTESLQVTGLMPFLSTNQQCQSTQE